MGGEREFPKILTSSGNPPCRSHEVTKGSVAQIEQGWRVSSRRRGSLWGLHAVPQDGTPVVAPRQPRACSPPSSGSRPGLRSWRPAKWGSRTGILIVSGFYLWWPRNWRGKALRNATWFRRGLSPKAGTGLLATWETSPVPSKREPNHGLFCLELARNLPT